jgi:putative FmdB family regulatory protein
VPLYEYECGSCGLRFERIRKFSDPPLTTCPDCGGTVSKLISSPAIQFKGSGWYITDYAKSGQKEPPGSGAKEGSPKDGAAKETGKTAESGESRTDSGKSSSENASSEKGASQKSGSERSSSGAASNSATPAATAKPAAADSKK